MKKWSKVYTGFILFFLFAPIVVMMVFSFNEARSLSVMDGFSLYWYQELFKDTEALRALRNTLILALCASLISTAMGTAAAVGIKKLRSKAARLSVDTVTNIPMMNPDIITGVSLMLMFVFVGRLFGASTSLNFWTMLCAHITFCLPYVILQVLPRLQQMDESLPEAAMDLGCTPLRAFFKVTLPEIMPGIATGLIMAFALSLDDFVISYFTVGNGFQTLPIFIYSMTKKTVTPEMYALATLIFFVILALLIFSNLAGDEVGDDAESTQAMERRHAKNMARQQKRGEFQQRMAERGQRRNRILMGSAAVLLALAIVGIVAGGSGNVRTLNVYNWGEYISDGADDTLDTIKAFEEWYEEEFGQKIKVNYSTYASNEDMYAKLSSGAVSYDVIFPSDYMIARMIDEGMLLELDYSNIPNFRYIDESYRGLYYDPENRYSVPYTYGVTGVIYNANVVDEADTGGWDLMWNSKYAGQIVQYNNSRDAFSTAQYMSGLNVNSEDKDDWNAALKLLQEQSPLVKSYVMDEIYNMMESGEAAIGSYYAGDYFTMLDAQADNVDLQFYYPQETNYFIDSMCIPSCCQDKELAELFINFMLSEEPAIANAEYIYYASPNSLVYKSQDYLEEMGEDTIAVLYPDLEEQGGFNTVYNKYAYRNMSNEMLAYINELWETLKIN